MQMHREAKVFDHHIDLTEVYEIVFKLDAPEETKQLT